MITQARLKELLHYDPETGVFTWLVDSAKNVKTGSIAGGVRRTGYAAMTVEGKTYGVHRLAWLYVNGFLPTSGIDHINRIKTDNRIANLRLANQSENNQNRAIHKNNTSGHIGVCWQKQTQKWKAQIQVERKKIHLGIFTDIADAVFAYKEAKEKYHKFNPTTP